jgi:hypothetical protein
MGPAASIVVMVLMVGLGALFAYLGVTRARVMRYHKVDTPQGQDWFSRGGAGGGVGGGDGGGS